MQILFGLWLIAGNLAGSISQYHGPYGPSRPKPPLYGIWDVSQMSINGQVRSPLLTDYGRWRRVIFDSYATPYMILQRMDDSVFGYQAVISAQKKTIALTKGGPDKNWKGDLTYQQPSRNSLVLDGELNKERIHMQLNLFDLNKFLLVSRGFHWIQDYPFNH